MCGIAGIALLQRKNISLKDTVFSMSRSLAHRGPDDEGFALFNEHEVSILALHTHKKLHFILLLTIAQKSVLKMQITMTIILHLHTEGCLF
jgi:asparagine synthetase B (glutamine-hydrolysing)